MGTFTADGGSVFRGACYFQASAPSLSSLNGVCCVYHFDVDAFREFLLGTFGSGTNSKKSKVIQGINQDIFGCLDSTHQTRF